MPGRQSQQEPQPVPPRGDVPGGGVESQPGNCAAVDAEPCWPLDARDPAGDGVVSVQVVEFPGRARV
jgi:hypothetical protein